MRNNIGWIVAALVTLLFVGGCNVARSTPIERIEGAGGTLASEAQRLAERARPAANVRSGRGSRIRNRHERRVRNRFNRSR